tara:strand:- start:130953 stop:131135 length:183 start_codon:yes stop_codon:yes gene_type:complete
MKLCLPAPYDGSQSARFSEDTAKSFLGNDIPAQKYWMKFGQIEFLSERMAAVARIIYEAL